MTDKRIPCSACNSENLDNSVYCCQCGAPMRKGIPVRIRKGQWIAVAVITLLLTCILTVAIQFITPPRISQPSFTEPQNQVVPKNIPARSDPVELSSPPLRNEKPSTGAVKMVVGKVSIINSDVGIVAEFPAVVVNGSWLALPSRACVGGDKWFFRSGNGKAIPIEGGLWGRGDPVGLWRLAGERKFKGPDFDAWQQGEPVRLLAMKTGLLSKPMTLTPSGVQGAFIYSPLSGPLEPGVFLQNGKVVGWSFGELLRGAYMWPLGHDANLLYENYVDDFYNETFVGGREELFLVAISMRRNSSPQRQLQMFAEAFSLPPKLSSKNTPRYLRTETVYPYIMKLVERVMDQGGYQDIAALAEEPLLWEIRDPELLKQVVLATRKNYNIEAAVNFIEGPGAGILQEIEGEKTELLQIHLDFYIGWIKNLLDTGDIVRGWQIYNRAQPRFSDSPELHLVAVELALAGGDWAEAETLLYQREYPASLRETRMLLTDRISDLKGRENKIVIRFAAGSREIPAKATLNGGLAHDFLIDTGASFVTIPYATVEALGLKGEMSPHQMEVQTAGGLVNARVVTLASIELQGWVVANVKALVIDLPKRPGLGLLGLNFLNSFRVDLQADEGILILEPK